MEHIQHIVRTVPPWSTCDPITICGNVAAASDMTISAMKAYIKESCRGSIKVAYGTCCVSCLEHINPWTRNNISQDAHCLEQYITKHGRHSKDRKNRIAIELSVLNKVLSEIDFRALVDIEIERGNWRNKTKTKRA